MTFHHTQNRVYLYKKFGLHSFAEHEIACMLLPEGTQDMRVTLFIERTLSNTAAGVWSLESSHCEEVIVHSLAFPLIVLSKCLAASALKLLNHNMICTLPTKLTSLSTILVATESVNVLDMIWIKPRLI